MKVKEKLTDFKQKAFSVNSLSFKEQLGYAGGIFGNCMGQDSIGTYADKFNRNFMGISNKLLLVKGNITTVLSFLIPPAAGALYDAPTKPGRKSNLRKALFAAQNIVSKATNLLKTNLYNILFTIIKYVPKDPGSKVKPVQTDSTLRGIYSIITFCGLAGNLLSALTFAFDNYEGKKREEIFAELVEMRKADEEALPVQ